MWVGNFDWALPGGGSSVFSWAHWWLSWGLTRLGWLYWNSSSLEKCGLSSFSRLSLGLFMAAGCIPREWPEACKASQGLGTELAPHHRHCYKASRNSRSKGVDSWCGELKTHIAKDRDTGRGRIKAISANSPPQIVNALWGPPTPWSLS